MVSSRLDIYQFTKDCGNKDKALKKVYSEHNAIFPQKQFQKMFFQSLMYLNGKYAWHYWQPAD